VQAYSHYFEEIALLLTSSNLFEETYLSFNRRHSILASLTCERSLYKSKVKVPDVIGAEYHFIPDIHK